MSQAAETELLQRVWDYPLFAALYGRRSRRFGLGGLAHHVNFRLHWRANLAFNWPHQVVQFAKSLQTTF